MFAASLPRRARAAGLLAVLSALLQLVVLTVTTGVSEASHISAISVTQAGNDNLAVTIQVDVTMTGLCCGGLFSWSTGDGRSASIDDGVANGVYAGDASGSGTFSGVGITDPNPSYTWQRSNPAPGVARTLLTYSYEAGGTYSVPWNDSSPSRSGTLLVSVVPTLLSDDCDAGTELVSAYSESTYVRAWTYRPDPRTQWVCFRIDTGAQTTEGALAVGGKLVVVEPSVDIQLPSVDSNVQACAADGGNLIPPPHPALAGAIGDPDNPPYAPFLVDAYANTQGAWLCLVAGTVRSRVVVPLSGVGLPTATFLADPPGTVDADAAPVAQPSGSCLAATDGVTRLADVSTLATRTYLYIWEPSASVVKICVRNAGVGAVGGVLTIDTNGAPGTLPNVTTSTDLTPCTTSIVEVTNPVVVRVRRGQTANSGSVCLVVGNTPLRVTATTGTLALPSIEWEPDAGTPDF